MKLTSATIHKMVKKLQDEKEYILNQEEKTEIYMSTEGYKDIIPDYSYSEVREKVDVIDLKIVKLKHAINLFNTTTVIPEYNITIDEMLVLIPQLSAKKQKLSEMALRLPKAREEQGYGRASNIIDYRYANYDIDEVNKDLLAVTDELSSAQLALDLINHSVTFEVEL